LKARANRAKSGSVNFSRRLSRRTTIKKSEKKEPEFRSRDRIRHGGNNSHGKDVEGKTGGPRQLL
jgi:hypothetical protein